jgi:hypothetical protein
MTKAMSLLALFLVSLGTGCSYGKTGSIRVLENPYLQVSQGPTVLAENLDHPAAPRLVNGELIFAEGGKGTINRLDDRRVTPLIEGFGVDDYFGYAVSVLGIEVVPEQEIWLVASAEGAGKVYLFDAREMPSSARLGQEITFDDSTELNPFDLILVGEGSTLLASGGTSKAYQAPFVAVNPSPLRPVLEVETGIAGLALDPGSGLVYGAVIGSGKGDGSVIRWNPTAEVIEPETMATGFNNLVDVLITNDDLLLALEFGSFDADDSGRVAIVDETGNVIPFITGLDAPSGFYLNEEGTLLITTFGTPGGSDGTLLSFTLDSP